MKRFALSTLLVLSISGLSMVNSFAEESQITLRTDISNITLTKNEPIFIQIYPSDLLGMKDPYGNTYLLFNGSRGATDSFQEGYKAKLDKKDLDSGIYTISISPSDPIKNGNYVLLLQEQRLRSNPIGESQTLRININVNIDAVSENLYETKFDFDCPIVYYGEVLKCTITPKLSGAGKNLATGLYSVQYSFKTSENNKWKNYKKFDWDINNGVMNTFGKLIKPTWLKVSITYNGVSYPFSGEVKPKPQITFFAPGAAIVGESFRLTAKAPKNYSSSCVVNNYSMQFTIKNGNGSILIYGQTPGNLNLYIACKSSNWADTGGYKFVYIRP
jgi:hypothetical protein